MITKKNLIGGLAGMVGLVALTGPIIYDSIPKHDITVITANATVKYYESGLGSYNQLTVFNKDDFVIYENGGFDDIVEKFCSSKRGCRTFGSNDDPDRVAVAKAMVMIRANTEYGKWLEKIGVKE